MEEGKRAGHFSSGSGIQSSPQYSFQEGHPLVEEIARKNKQPPHINKNMSSSTSPLPAPHLPSLLLPPLPTPWPGALV